MSGSALRVPMPQPDGFWFTSTENRSYLVAVWKFDRFARSVSHLLRLIPSRLLVAILARSTARKAPAPETFARAFHKPAQTRSAIRLRSNSRSEKHIVLRPYYGHVKDYDARNNACIAHFKALPSLAPGVVLEGMADPGPFPADLSYHSIPCASPKV
jgi:hypothetical protein